MSIKKTPLAVETAFIFISIIPKTAGGVIGLVNAATAYKVREES